MTEPSRTEILLQRWHAGDDSALHTLLEEELPWIRNKVRSRLGPLLKQLGDAEDYVQDAMVRILKRGPRFKISDRDNFRGLLAVLIENTLREEHKFHKRERRNHDRIRSLPRDSVLDLDPPRRGVTRPSAVAQKHEETAWLDLAMELLAPLDCQVVRLRTWDGLSFIEIGELVGVKENAARMRFQRALAKMAQYFVRLRAGQLGAVLAEREQ